MFGMFRDPVKEGVKSAFDEASKPGGPIDKAIGDAFASALEPIAKELAELRYIRARYTWHPLEGAKPWVFDGRTHLLYRDGDMIFGHWQAADGDIPGYWDACEEYGGEPIEPPPTHFYILRKRPVVPPQALRDHPLKASES